eukprot:TRINITY_DN4249_c0_g1_i1.p1 TRINITY_DN4249_c0_g1~~TRINITY_DN4249_c0_g1_i1.p1  ORF type:complete len:551 (+),score=103.76 TRINITY_DN4249_c0_g1_i1:313-1965(+)
MALVRCNRGGKTRSLKEICYGLKDLPDIKNDKTAIIFISMNHDTSLLDWEREKPIEAVCRRIAHAVSRNQIWNEFANIIVTAEQILEWLGNHPCILVIDELNQLQETIDNQTAAFLKNNFLTKDKRYLIFSSHVVSMLGDLRKFMEASSARPVIVKELPLIPSLAEARKNLGFSELSPREALYFGFIPALIYSRKEGSEIAICVKFAQACKNVIKEVKGFSDGDIKNILRTFITGDTTIPSLLLQFVDSVTENNIKWIPFHMTKILYTFATTQPPILSQGLCMDIHKMIALFEKVKDAEAESGKAWEAMFALVLWIRCITRLFDRHIFPPPYLGKSELHVSFNDHVKPSFQLDQCKSIEDLVKGIAVPKDLPHIVIYYPSNAKFRHYDTIVIYYDEEASMTISGYQKKEGNDLSRKEPMDSLVKNRYLIRGQPAKETSKSGSWILIGKNDLQVFMGTSGMHWTPEEWSRWSSAGLKANEKKLNILKGKKHIPEKKRKQVNIDAAGEEEEEISEKEGKKKAKKQKTGKQSGRQQKQRTTSDQKRINKSSKN